MLIKIRIKTRGVDWSLVQKRSWPEIVTKILEVTTSPSNKMKIMYSSNLNFQSFNSYFNNLLIKGLIEETKDSDDRNLYKITERGKTLLEVLRKADEMLFSDK